LASENALTVGVNGLDLRPTIIGDREFSGSVTITGDLQVDGDLTYVNTTNLAIQDALITIGSGSSAFATGYGIEFGAMGDNWASLQTAQYDYDQDDSADNVLSSSLPIRAENISADSFWGNLIGNVAANVYNRAGNATMAVGVNWYDAESSSRVATLPTGSNLVEGDMVKIKAGNLTGAGAIVITAAGSDTIDGPHGSITLESAYAAVSLVYVGGGEWRVF